GSACLAETQKQDGCQDKLAIYHEGCSDKIEKIISVI
ncbi:hypothetical protein EZS27_042531, partial [termite gut metagenome]